MSAVGYEIHKNTDQNTKMEYFEDFLLKSSLHGLNYIADKNTSGFRKIFWFLIFLAGVTAFTVLARDSLSEFLSSKTKIDIEETHADLSEVVFPAVVVCNNNQFRRSFAYWIIDMMKKDGELDDDPIITDGGKRELTEEEQQVFDLIRNIFFEGSTNDDDMENSKLLDKILESTFIKDYVDEFLAHHNSTHWTEKYGDRTTSFEILSDFLDFGNETSSTLLIKKLFVALAGQWKRKQMIPYIEWKGALDKSDKTDEIGLDMMQSTSSRICTWIGPLAHKISNTNLTWPTGVKPGENNGLSVFLDTESYDYVEKEKGGLGFTLSVVHPLAMPIMEQSGIKIQTGAAIKLGVSSTLTRTSEDAVRRFSPYERKCWVESEIRFYFIPYEQLYHYSMPNCLFEAAMQEAYQTCDCIPSFIYQTQNQCFGKKLRCYFDIIEKLGEYEKHS